MEGQWKRFDLKTQENVAISGHGVLETRTREMTVMALAIGTSISLMDRVYKNWQ